LGGLRGGMGIWSEKDVNGGQLIFHEAKRRYTFISPEHGAAIRAFVAIPCYYSPRPTPRQGQVACGGVEGLMIRAT
jgi:hypothetical protein